MMKKRFPKLYLHIRVKNMHGPPKMVDVMADMIQKGARQHRGLHSKGQVSNTSTHLKGMVCPWNSIQNSIFKALLA